jgi:methionine-S-sulfoxide reductase
LAGVVRTRVGYAGGTTKDPTYSNIGDHSETIQIDYDPTKITYKELLKVFWSSHSPCQDSGIRQYKAILFYHNEEQKKLALETRDQEAARRKSRILTEIVPACKFYLAEDYHQKYALRGNDVLMQEFNRLYPKAKDFTDSTAAARVNAYLDGHGTYAALQKEIKSFGLSAEGNRVLLEAVKRNREPAENR